ncbi:signal peptidase II [Actinokineospora pegani]|uniref:signal peptidase II n=1 Tax=Actinokineospora pegani TaxID=2654637 RepID=UPI001F1DEF1A|nr:signal peptidase II [Actinokineospora pegani]
MTPNPAPLPPRRAVLLLVTAFLVYALDLVTKILVTANLEGEPPVRILGGVVYLDLIRNSGAAFSMASGMTWLLTLVAIGVVVAIVWIMPKLRSVGWALGLGLVLAGALGNLTDRLFRAPGPFVGHVVDFVSLFGPNGEYFAVFNVADSGISVGGVLIVLLALRGREFDGSIIKKEPKKPKGEKPVKSEETAGE